VIVIATVIGMLINFIGINPIDALFWTAVINGFVAPPLMVLIMLIANNRAVMQERTNGLAVNILGRHATAVRLGRSRVRSSGPRSAVPRAP